MPAEQRKSGKYTLDRPAMTAAERYAYKSLPESLRRRKESVDDTVVRILEFLDLVKEVGEEISVLGDTPYSPDGSGTYDPEHVAEREEMLGQQFAGELAALQVFDQVKHENIRREVGLLGRDFVKKITALQQLMESFWARFCKVMSPFTRSKAGELDKFEAELRQRLTDINYLTRQHAELMAAAQDAKAGDQEETNDEIIAEYQDDIMAYVKEYDALREEYGTLGRLAFRRRREILDRLATRADAIKAINKRYEHYDFIDFITFELPDDEG